MTEDNNMLSSEKITQIKQQCLSRTPVNIEIAITDRCNCKCAYCFEGSNCQSKVDRNIQARQLQLIEQYCKTFDTAKHSFLVIDFWGGEPTLNMSFIEEIINKTILFPFVRYHMYSNGILFSNFFKFLFNEHIDELRNRLQIQLSYDGEPHNTIKRGKFKDQIFKTFEMLKENGFHIAFKATLSYDMIKQLPEIWKSYEDACNKFGLEYVQYHPTLDTAYDENNIKYFNDWKNALIIIAKYELDFVKQHGHNLMTWFSSLDERAVCGLSNRVHLDVDGNIYVCHGCPYSKHKQDFCLGNVNDIDSLTTLIDRDVQSSFRNSQCIECGATFCNQCHVSIVDSSDYEKTWLSSLGKDKIRCMFFKYFGKVKNAYDMVLLNSKVNNISGE